MTSISSLNSAALLNLQQSKTLSVSPSAAVPLSSDMVATTKGIVNKPERSESEATLDYWGVLSADVTGPKLSLIEQLGTEFGINQEDYDSISAYGEAIRLKVAGIKREPQGFQTIIEVEKNLRLNDLGITLDELIDVISNPQGSAEVKLDMALEKVADEHVFEKENVPEPNSTIDSITVDENGIYSLSG